MKVHVVDGTYELFRAHFGAPAASAGGREVGAVRGILRTLASLVSEPGVTHVACAFDTVIESFRNQLFAGYKTSLGVPAELLAQFPIAERACEALGIVTWRMIEFEADDALATAAARFAERPEVEQVVVCTPDKDLAQCVRGDRVVCLDRMRRRVLDEPGVHERFGVAPRSIPDWLALVGDDADGIPGVPGWGAKSAAAVLARYGRLEDIPADPRQWDLTVRSRERLAATLLEHRDVVGLYRTLATLRTDVPLAEDLGALAWRGVRAAELDALCRELEDDFVQRSREPLAAAAAAKAVV